MWPVVAEMELNKQNSLPFVSPQLIPYLQPDVKMVHMTASVDVSNDLWANGCFIHEMISCVNPVWHETFYPAAAIAQARGLSAMQQKAMFAAALQREHHKLVSSTPMSLVASQLHQSLTCSDMRTLVLDQPQQIVYQSINRYIAVGLLHASDHMLQGILKPGMFA